VTTPSTCSTSHRPAVRCAACLNVCMRGAAADRSAGGDERDRHGRPSGEIALVFPFFRSGEVSAEASGQESRNRSRRLGQSQRRWVGSFRPIVIWIVLVVARRPIPAHRASYLRFRPGAKRRARRRCDRGDRGARNACTVRVEATPTRDDVRRYEARADADTWKPEIDGPPGPVPTLRLRSGSRYPEIKCTIGERNDGRAINEPQDAPIDLGDANGGGVAPIPKQLVECAARKPRRSCECV